MEKTIRLALLLAVALPLIVGACVTAKKEMGDDDSSGDDDSVGGSNGYGCCYYIECDADQYWGGMEGSLTQDQCKNWCNTRRQKPELAHCRTGYSAACPPTGPDWYESPKGWCGKK